MENENENLDSLNGENENANSQNGESNEGQPDLDALKKANEELSEKNKKLFERAKKSEGDLKELKTKYPEKKPEENLEKSQSNEPDYATKLAVKAYLKSEGITHPDDQKWIQDEASRLKMNPDEILIMEHVKSHMETSKTQREAMEGMPKGRGSAGVGKGQQDVDYWVDKKDKDGNYETPDDPELAEKIIDARMKKEEGGHKFSDELYSG